MSKRAEVCPVCRGSGKYKEYNANFTFPVSERTCHGCGGQGWVEVGTDYQPPSKPPKKINPPWNWPSSFKPVTYIPDEPWSVSSN